MKKPKKKRVSVSSVKKQVWQIFSKYIRLRDCFSSTGSPEYGECFTCSASLPVSQLQAGHFVPKHSGNYFSERGVHAQCRTCNLYGRDGQAAGMPLEYRRQIIKLYGEGADTELENEARETKKFTIPELEEMIVDYKNRIGELTQKNRISYKI